MPKLSKDKKRIEDLKKVIEKVDPKAAETFVDSLPEIKDGPDTIAIVIPKKKKGGK